MAIRGLFFVPVLPDLARAARITTEIEADAAAVSRHGHSDLIRALKSVLAAAPRTPVGGARAIPRGLPLADGTPHILRHESATLVGDIDLI